MSKSFKKRKGNRSKGKLARQVARNAKVLRMIGKPEMKFHIVSVSQKATSTGAFASLTLLTQGDDETERIGNAIKLHSMDISLEVEADSNASANLAQACRIIVLKDKSPVYQSALSDTFLLNQTYIEGLVYNKPNRFVVYYDKVVTMSRNGAADGFDGPTRLKYLRKLNINLHGQVQEYETDVNTTAIGQNLYVYILGHQATYGPDVSGYIRLNYTDV